MSFGTKSPFIGRGVSSAGTLLAMAHALSGCSTDPARAGNDASSNATVIPDDAGGAADIRADAPSGDAGTVRDAAVPSDTAPALDAPIVPSDATTPVDAPVVPGDAGGAGDRGADVPSDAMTTGLDAAAVDAGDASEAGAIVGPLTCSPATRLDPRPWDECANGFCRCRTYAPDGGGLVLDNSTNTIMNITSLQLVDPMKAGQPYSLSVSVSNYRFFGDIEFWGATSECGSGLQKLFSAPVDSKVFCADVLPAQSYSHVLFVERLMVDSGAPASEHADNILACPTGRCGP